MKIVVIGGTGLIGRGLVEILQSRGHAALPASPKSGVDTLTGQGLEAALAGADAVVDVTNSPSFADDDVMRFFDTSTRNILAAERNAGVGHHVALSVVGTDRLPESGYLRAKVAQEKLIAQGGVPFSILRATQFYEFLGAIADSCFDGSAVRVPPILMQPIAARDVSAGLADVVLGAPLHGMAEIGGPERIRLDELARQVLRARGDVVRSSGTRRRTTTERQSTTGRWSSATARGSARRGSRTGCRRRAAERTSNGVKPCRHDLSISQAARPRAWPRSPS